MRNWSVLALWLLLAMTGCAALSETLDAIFIPDEGGRAPSDGIEDGIQASGLPYAFWISAGLNALQSMWIERDRRKKKKLAAAPAPEQDELIQNLKVENAGLRALAMKGTGNDPRL